MWVSDWYRQHRRARRRHDDHPLLLGRRPESRRLGVPDEHRVDPGRPAVDGRVGDLWAGHGEPESARRSSSCTDDQRSSGRRRRTGARGFLPAMYQGTQFRRGDTPILDLKPPAGDQRRSSSAASSAFCKELNQHLGGGQAGRHRTGCADALLRAGVPDAVGRVRKRWI